MTSTRVAQDSLGPVNVKAKAWAKIVKIGRTHLQDARRCTDTKQAPNDW
jgi:fumarate hydratase class II